MVCVLTLPCKASLTSLASKSVLFSTSTSKAFWMESNNCPMSLLVSTASLLLPSNRLARGFQSDGNIWVGCLDGDMACFPSDKYNLDGTGKSVFHLPVNEVQCITESPDKRFIAVGTSHGGYLIDKREPLHPRRFFYPEQYPGKDINLFVNNFFVVRCQIMSCPAVSLTMLPSGYYFVNPFFPKISLSYVYFRKVNFTVSVHLSRKDIFPPYFISISHPSHLSLTSHQSGRFPLAQIHCPSWNPG